MQPPVRDVDLELLTFFVSLLLQFNTPIAI